MELTIEQAVQNIANSINRFVGTKSEIIALENSLELLAKTIHESKPVDVATKPEPQN